MMIYATSVASNISLKHNRLELSELNFGVFFALLFPNLDIIEAMEMFWLHFWELSCLKCVLVLIMCSKIRTFSATNNISQKTPPISKVLLLEAAHEHLTLDSHMGSLLGVKLSVKLVIYTGVRQITDKQN